MSQPCDKCPESAGIVIPPTGKPASQPSVANYVVYTGGPFVLLYRMVELAIPPDADLKHGRPAFHDDGSLEYPPGETEPEDIEGYQRDAETPRRFHPVWPECLHRPLCVSVRDQLLIIAARCQQPATGRMNRIVTMNECQVCTERRAPHPAPPQPRPGPSPDNRRVEHL